MSNLPIHAVLPDLLSALRARSSAVLIAPPGAGKTTAVAPALLAESWCTGSVIVLSPRRVAARAAAERMAELMGEPVGQTIGYLTRLDSKRSAKTRVLVMTEAIFVSTLLNDPELAGVSAVLFDEAHERHLDSDLGLALAIESQAVLREDLRLVVMSATLDGARFASLLGEAPVIESEGKAWPLTVRIGRAAAGSARPADAGPAVRASAQSRPRREGKRARRPPHRAKPPGSRWPW
ncbi:MAG: ATP-dependent helicase HrpB, partial [Pseudomonadota bacterium]